MELKVLVDKYSAGEWHFDLCAGDTTHDKDISDEKKRQMLSDFPDWFEVVEGGADVVIETAEDKLEITPKEKAGKAKRK